MANELVKIEKLPMAELMSISKCFAESGMFENMKSMAQAFVKIQAGQEIGIPPFAAMSGIHIIKGKPAIGAGLMASRLKGSGKYDYKVVDQTEKICSIDFYQGKEKIGNSTFTIEEARKAGTQNLDKFPRNMLFARAISNGVKWFCPDIFSGPVYTPEEMGEIEQVTEDVMHEVVTEPTDKKEPVKPEEKKLQVTTATKDPITLSIIQKLVNRIAAGDASILEKAIATYSMEEGELKILQEEHEKLLQTNQQQKAA